jgi:hypothetical protein
MSDKLTPEEMAKNLEEFAEDFRLEEEARRLPTMTKAEVAASLAGSGHDQEKARAIGRRAAEAFAKAAAEAEAKRAAEAPVAKVVPIGSRRAVRYLVPLAAAAAVVAALAAFEGPAIVAWLSAPPGPDDIRVGAGRGRLEEAHALRQDAYKDYSAERYAECLQKLDEAKALDASGETSVEWLRARAQAGLAEAGAQGGAGE